MCDIVMLNFPIGLSEYMLTNDLLCTNLSYSEIQSPIIFYPVGRKVYIVSSYGQTGPLSGEEANQFFIGSPHLNFHP